MLEPSCLLASSPAPEGGWEAEAEANGMIQLLCPEGIGFQHGMDGAD